MKKALFLLIPCAVLILYFLIRGLGEGDEGGVTMQPDYSAEGKLRNGGNDIQSVVDRTGDNNIGEESAPQKHDIQWKIGDPSLVSGRIKGEVGLYYTEIGELIFLVKSASANDMAFLVDVYENGFFSESLRAC